MYEGVDMRGGGRGYGGYCGDYSFAGPDLFC